MGWTFSSACENHPPGKGRAGRPHHGAGPGNYRGGTHPRPNARTSRSPPRRLLRAQNLDGRFDLWFAINWEGPVLGSLAVIMLVLVLPVARKPVFSLRPELVRPLVHLWFTLVILALAFACVYPKALARELAAVDVLDASGLRLISDLNDDLIGNQTVRRRPVDPLLLLDGLVHSTIFPASFVKDAIFKQQVVVLLHRD